MAKIYAMPNRDEWEKKSGEDWDSYYDRQKAMMAALDKKARLLSSKEYAGAILRRSIADGYAVYYVLSLKPLVLCHVPFGDGYRDRYFERTATSRIVKEEVDHARKFAAIWNRKAAPSISKQHLSIN